MPDLTAGSKVKALDTPPTVSDVENGTFTFDATTYGTDHDSGTYADCGAAFVACSTGRAMVLWRAQPLNNTGGQSTFCSYVIRTGAVVGSGSSVVAAADSRALEHAGTDTPQAGTFDLVSGLTPGDTYNVRLEHRVTGGVGTLLNRSVAVAPAT
jgi:hypothetical protein